MVSAELYENAERTFLTPKGKIGNEKNNVPSLDQFDKEIDIYKVWIIQLLVLLVLHWHDFVSNILINK